MKTQISFLNTDDDLKIRNLEIGDWFICKGYKYIYMGFDSRESNSYQAIIILEEGRVSLIKCAFTGEEKVQRLKNVRIKYEI